MSLRRGIRIGVDVGTVRVSVRMSDPDGILTMPVVTLTRAPDSSDLGQLADIVAQHEAIEVIVGLPRHLRGGEGISAKGARKYARRLKKLMGACALRWSTSGSPPTRRTSVCAHPVSRSVSTAASLIRLRRRSSWNRPWD